MTLRILHFSPSTATDRHDSYRASLAFTWFARQAVEDLGASIPVDLVWALPAVGSREQAHRLISAAELTVIATPTYAQGSPWFVRRYLELCAGLQLWGRLGTAFATAGGLHTGGDVAVSDTLRSLMGMGMATFTFAQKLVVFGAQQKFAPDGTFDLVDLWFLQQLARTSVAHLAGRSGSRTVGELARFWNLNTSYYQQFPSAEELTTELGGLRDQLNAPLTDPSAYQWWSDCLAMDAFPPDASALPFFDLFPQPTFASPTSDSGPSFGVGTAATHESQGDSGRRF